MNSFQGDLTNEPAETESLPVMGTKQCVRLSRNISFVTPKINFIDHTNLILKGWKYPTNVPFRSQNKIAGSYAGLEELRTLQEVQAELVLFFLFRLYNYQGDPTNASAETESLPPAYSVSAVLLVRSPWISFLLVFVKKTFVASKCSKIHRLFGFQNNITDRHWWVGTMGSKTCARFKRYKRSWSRPGSLRLLQTHSSPRKAERKQRKLQRKKAQAHQGVTRPSSACMSRQAACRFSSEEATLRTTKSPPASQTVRDRHFTTWHRYNSRWTACFFWIPSACLDALILNVLVGNCPLALQATRYVCMYIIVCIHEVHTWCLRYVSIVCIRLYAKNQKARNNGHQQLWL